MMLDLERIFKVPMCRAGDTKIQSVLNKAAVNRTEYMASGKKNMKKPFCGVLFLTPITFF